MSFSIDAGADTHYGAKIVEVLVNGMKLSEVKEFRFEETPSKLRPFVCAHGAGFCDRPKCRNRYRALEWLELKAFRKRITSHVISYDEAHPAGAR